MRAWNDPFPSSIITDDEEGSGRDMIEAAERRPVFRGATSRTRGRMLQSDTDIFVGATNSKSMKSSHKSKPPRKKRFVTPVWAVRLGDIFIQLWDVVKCPPLMSRVKFVKRSKSRGSSLDYSGNTAAFDFQGASCDKEPFTTVDSVTDGVSACPAKAAGNLPQPTIIRTGSVVCCAGKKVKSHAPYKVIYPEEDDRRSLQNYVCIGHDKELDFGANKMIASQFVHPCSAQGTGTTCRSNRVAIVAGNSTVVDPYVDEVRYGRNTPLRNFFTLYLFTPNTYYKVDPVPDSADEYYDVVPEVGYSCAPFLNPYPVESTPYQLQSFTEGTSTYSRFAVSPDREGSFLIACDGDYRIVSVISFDYRA